MVVTGTTVVSVDGPVADAPKYQKVCADDYNEFDVPLSEEVDHT